MLNTEQQSAVDSTSQNILVLAGAGSGKSTVLLSRISRLIGEGISPSSILALTFTNAAALEMRKRYSKSHPNAILPTFCTFHGFCYSLIIRDAEIRHQMGYNSIPTMADTATIKKLETMCKQQCGTKLSQDKLNGKEPLSPKDKFQYDIYWKQYNKLLRQQNLITFDIMCYEVCELFVNNNPIVDKYKKQYIHIFVDEFQDTDDKQWSFVKSFEKSNKFIVGDAKQCQPAGTLITMIDGSKRPIETLNAGDYVLSYNVRKGYFPKTPKEGFGKRITEIASHETDLLYEVHADNYKTKYTSNHITYAKIHYDGNENKHVVYLMRNDIGWWRVGSTQLFAYKDRADFGASCRLRTEHGRDVWILDIVDTSKEAWIIEQTVSYKFGIPQMTWIHKNVRCGIEEMDTVYKTLGDLEHSAEMCLKYYNRDIKYPLHSIYGGTHFSKEHIFEIRACNLIPGVMDVAVPYVGDNNKWKLKYVQISEIVADRTPTTVYSLDVEVNHNYIADDILTHNSIYQFRGGDSSIIKSITKKSDWQTIKMGHNYRSTNQICDYANDIHRYWINSPYNLSIHSDVDGAEVVENSEFHCFGELGKECVRSIVKSIIPNKSMAILCRTNAEVADVKKLLKQNNILFCSNSSTLENIEDILKSAMDDEYMVDWLSSQLNQTDYINFVKMSTIDDSYLSGERFISEYREKLNADLLNQIFSVRKILASEQALYQKGVDITNLLKLPKKPINLALNTIEELIKYILDLIDELDIDTNIYVGTIHSVKGLEYDIVHVIGVDGDSFKLNCEDMYNLFYVACTRAKEQLYIWKS